MKPRGFTLVAMMIAVVIVLILAVVLFEGPSLFGAGAGHVKARPDRKGTTVLGQVRYDAEDTVCQSDLNQLRMAIQLFEQTNDDRPPSSLEETKLGAEFYSCPVGHEPYAYDPATGQVHCVHPGHEKY